MARNTYDLGNTLALSCEAKAGTAKRLAAFSVLAAALSAVGCGGGNTSSDTSAVIAQEAEPPTALQMVVEARNGKTTIDAWFQSALRTTAEPLSEDHCERVTHTATAMPRATNPETDTDIRIVSRDGDTARLVAHQTGGLTSYHMEQRWLDDPVPDDAVLMFTTGSEFDIFDSTTLPSLQPLTWTEPVLTAPTDAGSALRWEPATANDTVVKLTLSGLYDDPDAQHSVIQCTVLDDGEFTLSAEWQALLGEGANQMLMRAKRVRTREFEQGDKRLSVMQIAHTDLVKP